MKKLLTTLAMISISAFTYSQTEGSNDNTFSVGTAFGNGNYSVRALDIQPDGKILVGGSFPTYQGTTASYMVRLNVDGSRDQTFQATNKFNDQVSAIKLLSNGKILVGGLFTEFNGVSRSRILRLNSDGTLDATFDPGAGLIGLSSGMSVYVSDFEIQTNGKILIAGGFHRYNGVDRDFIARLNTDGSLDTSFDPGDGFSGFGYTRDIAIQPDGKILVGGTFNEFDGWDQLSVARLNSDGSFDDTFGVQAAGATYGTGGDVNCIKVLSDGKIIVAGEFGTYNGYPLVKPNNIVRLLPNGNYDNSFVSTQNAFSLAFNESIESIAIQPDGKIIAGGSFTAFHGDAQKRLIRLNTDGTIDNSFSIGSGLGQWVSNMSWQDDGKLVMGGYFVQYNGATRNKITRIHAYTVNTSGITDMSKIDVQVYPNPTSETLTITGDDRLKRVTLYNTLGQTVEADNPSSNSITLDLTHLVKGIYILQVEKTDGSSAKTKIIKD
ncbi:MAG: T9SS type A sorting domain-containing protein [Flavobacteriales bacterium]|nr:T9SS type A sorting domain-containing protein [Flavobacteriales bacterium]